MPDTNPNTDINLQEVSTRNEQARHVVAGFASAMPWLAEIWEYLEGKYSVITWSRWTFAQVSHRVRVKIPQVYRILTLEGALNDVPVLSAEVSRLSAGLRETRFDRANLLAAMRATLAAHADGEADPMWYLRDELDAPENGSADSRRRA